jgi:hypothetical protein
MSVIAHLAEDDFIIGGDAMYVAGQLVGSEPPPARPADAHKLRPDHAGARCGVLRGDRADQP